MKNFKAFWENLPMNADEAKQAIISLGMDVHHIKDGDVIPFRYVEDLVFMMAFGDTVQAYIEELRESRQETAAEQIANQILASLSKGIH